jgi:CubicO group peptidase (beta-lactamase class C family)
MLLQAVAEAVTGVGLDTFCRERLYLPLGLRSLGFHPLPVAAIDLVGKEPGPLGVTANPTENQKPQTANLIYAATEPGLIPGRSMFGQVHDENAWAAGGVAGHSGLFGSGPEVFELVAAIYRAYHGAIVAPFQSAPVRRFLTVPPGGTRALGFDTPAPEAGQCSCGRYFSPASVGHLGFTGTSFWLDLELGQMVVLLTNRVHLGREDLTKIRAFRPRFHEAASRPLGFEKIFRK